MKFDEDKILSLLKKEVPSLHAIYLFGSMASSLNNKNSDLDLAFLATNTISSTTRFDISQEIASILNIDVDLIDLQAASEVMRFEIISKGRCLFSDNSTFVENFEDKAYMLYIYLNENRLEILNDIKKRGKVF
jgi:predicted nucleotidyltransferase